MLTGPASGAAVAGVMFRVVEKVELDGRFRPRMTVVCTELMGFYALWEFVC